MSYIQGFSVGTVNPVNFSVGAVESNPIVNQGTQQPSSENDPKSPVLTEALILRIFSLLDLSSLGTVRQVCKDWNRIGGDDLLWENAVYRGAFSNMSWARCFGSKVIADEDLTEERASLPWREYIRDCQTLQSVFPVERASDTMCLVRLPQDLTLNILVQRAKEKYRLQNFGKNLSPCSKDWPEVLAELGDVKNPRSRWIMMLKMNLPGSQGQFYTEQQKIVTDLTQRALNGYEVAEVLEAATCIFSQHFLDQGRRPVLNKPWTYTYCQEVVGSFHTIVGDLSSAGLALECPTAGDVGVMPVRRF